MEHVQGADRGTALRSARGEVAIAIGTLAFAGLVYFETTEIPVSPLYAKVGPTVLPTMVSVGLAVLGVLMLVAALRGGWQSREERESSPDRRALGWVLLGLTLNVALIGRAGFAIASVAVFVCIARGFGSQRPLRDAAIGFAIAVLAYFGFAKALGIDIGGGIVEGVLERLIALLRGK